MIIKHNGTDISKLVKKITWSGARLQVARKLIFDYVQDARDPNLPNYVINNGETVYGYDEDGNLQFQGNVYSIEKNTQESNITVTAYDNLFILCRSKTTRKFANMTPEAITQAVCAEMGIKTGTIIETGKQVSFIAAEKTGYQIIMRAYTDAAKQINNAKANANDPDVLYHLVMNGDQLDVIQKGTLIESFTADQYSNIENSQYKESIENLVDVIMITDEQGNVTGYQSNEDWIKKYSMIQDVYKSSPKANTQEKVKAMLKGPDRTGTLDLLGDYRVKSSYSIPIKDIQTELTGQFWVKSDSHTFENGMHFMRLEIEFENLMNEVEWSDSKGIGKGKLPVSKGLTAGYKAWGGVTMDNGQNGCAEAVGKVGSYYSPFLAQEANAGVTGVPTMVSDAQDSGIAVESFDPGNLQKGDCIVYGDNDHIVIYDGSGGYYGNSSSANHVVHSHDYTDVGMTPTKIIKTSRG